MGYKSSKQSSCLKRVEKRKHLNKVFYSYDKTLEKHKDIYKRHFTSFNFQKIWNVPVNKLSDGQKHWLKTIVGLEEDPRVLLIDDYGVYLDNKNEMILRKRLLKMNDLLGTTIILSSYSEYFLKQFASVVIYLDNGHIAKIRKGRKRLNYGSKNKR